MDETLKINLGILVANMVTLSFFIFTQRKFYLGYKERDYEIMIYWGFWSFISFILFLSTIRI